MLKHFQRRRQRRHTHTHTQHSHWQKASSAFHSARGNCPRLPLGRRVRAKQTIICINNLFCGSKQKRQANERALTPGGQTTASKSTPLLTHTILSNVDRNTQKIQRPPHKNIYGKCAGPRNIANELSLALGYFPRPRPRKRWETRWVRATCSNVCQVPLCRMNLNSRVEIQFGMREHVFLGCADDDDNKLWFEY